MAHLRTRTGLNSIITPGVIAGGQPLPIMLDLRDIEVGSVLDLMAIQTHKSLTMRNDVIVFGTP